MFLQDRTTISCTNHITLYFTVVITLTDHNVASPPPLLYFTHLPIPSSPISHPLSLHLTLAPSAALIGSPFPIRVVLIGKVEVLSRTC